MDTRWWNLGFGVAATTAMTACGPTITLDDETGGETITAGETDSETTPTTEPPPVECIDSSDCEAGFECIDNECVYYDYCADGGCCDYGYDGCCYGDCCYGDCYYYECYTDADCGSGELCESFQECYFVDPIQECAEAPELLPLPIIEGSEDAIVSLSFVDADGDASADLVVSHESGATTLTRNTGESIETTPLPFAPGVPVVDVVSADFTGDGLPDLAGADTNGTITILAGDGLGGSSPVTEAPAVDPVQDLEVLDWNGDGSPDLAILGGDALAVVYVGDGAGDFMQAVSLSTDNSAYAMVSGSFGADAFDDVAVHTDNRGFVFWGNAVDDTQADGELLLSGHGRRGLVAADYDGGGIADIAGHTSIESFDGGWTLVEGWRDGSGELARRALHVPVETARSGDVDGDGIADTVMLGGDTLSLLRGSPESGSAPLFSCTSTVPLGWYAHLLAVGDFDGDGLAELAVGSSSAVVVLTRAVPE